MAKPPPTLKNIRRLWGEMSALITDEGGWVVSAPNHPEIRMQTPVDSDLPEMLEGLGYTLASAGHGERLLPSGNGIMPAVVQTWTFVMPQLLTPKAAKTIKPSF